MAKPKHDPEVKAAVLAALRRNESVDAVSKAYKVPIRTVYYWGEQARAETNGAPPALLEGAPRPVQARAARAPVNATEQAIRAELRATQHKLSILRQALVIVAGG
jgi:transposase-like protein